MKKALLSLSAVAVIALLVPTTACSNGGSCTYVSKCGNDAPMTADQITSCNAKQNNSACGGLYSDYLGCFQSHQTCTASGTTDYTITQTGQCGPQYEKWQNCCFGTDGGVADGGFPQCGQ